jgi:glycosyltransferase involved in cell wall biosynthesis
MRILLIGEYSRLHNSLKEGLLVLGHEVVLASDGDDFKNYPNDLSYDAKWSKSKLFYYPRRVFLKLFKLDLATLERGLRFYFLLPKLKGFDVVQLINEAAINTSVSLEIFLLQKVKEQNGKLFLLSSGADAIGVQFMLENKFKYSILTPYLEKRETRNEYPYILRYVSKNHLRLHDYVFDNINGVIATDFDYVLPLLGHQKYSGLVPNPINISKIDFSPLVITDKIVLFLGINRYNYVKKGIRFFEEALAEIEKKYGEKVEIIITENIPYEQYIELYNKAHILLDQVYAYDQGYNALEAMAKGKVVFTGAEEEFTTHYQLTERVAINALPDVNDLVKELSFLIDNPEEIIAIGQRARTFIEKEHDYRMIGKSYIKKWTDY